MTVASTLSKVTANGNGAARTWPFNFPVKDASHLRVVITDPAGAQTVLTSGYTVSLTGSGGTVTYPVSGTPLAAGYKITLRRVVPLTQETALANQDGFYAEVHEDRFDLLAMADQQQQEQLDRAVKAPPTDTTPFELPTQEARATRLMGFDAQGRPVASSTTVEALDALTLQALQSGQVSAVLAPFISDGVQTVINTPVPLSAQAQVTLVAGGIVQAPNSGAYTVSRTAEGGAITLASPFPEGVTVGGYIGFAREVGRGVTSFTINGSGHLVVTYTTDEVEDLGLVVATNGTNGRGISSATVDGSGHLILTYTDSTTADVGQVTGAVAWTAITGKPASFPPSSHTHGNADITSLDAAKITSGTIDIARLPAAALERLVNVANQTARYALTTATVQIGDTVREADTGLMYMVVDEAHLGDSGGWQAYTATSASSVPWTGITGKPSTVSGYGITDALTLTSSAPAALGPTAAAGSGTTAARADHAHQYQKESIVIALGDETTAITTGTAKVTIRMPYAFTLTDARASLATAGSSATIVNVKEAGTPIFSTKLQIDAGAKTSVGSAAPRVLSDASLADDAEITLDIDTAGTGAKGLKVTLIGRQSA